MVPISNIRNPPISDELFEKLNGMFEGLKKQLRHIENEYLDKVNQPGSTSTPELFEEDERVKRIEHVFSFFFEHNLIFDAKEKYQWFMKSVHITNKNILAAKSGNKAQIDKKSKILNALQDQDYGLLA